MQHNLIFDNISSNSPYNEKCFGQICRENQNTHFMFTNYFPKIVPFMSKCGKILQRRAGHRWQYGACACRISDAPDIHSEYVILTAFPMQRWLHESASTLRYTYNACLVKYLLHAIRASTDSVGAIIVHGNCSIRGAKCVVSL